MAQAKQIATLLNFPQQQNQESSLPQNRSWKPAVTQSHDNQVSLRSKFKNLAFGSPEHQHITLIWTMFSNNYMELWTSRYGLKPDDMWTEYLLTISTEIAKLAVYECFKQHPDYPPKLSQFMKIVSDATVQPKDHSAAWQAQLAELKNEVNLARWHFKETQAQEMLEWVEKAEKKLADFKAQYPEAEIITKKFLQLPVPPEIVEKRKETHRKESSRIKEVLRGVKDHKANLAPITSKIAHKSPEEEKAYQDAWKDCLAREEKARDKLSAMMESAKEA